MVVLEKFLYSRCLRYRNTATLLGGHLISKIPIFWESHLCFTLTCIIFGLHLLVFFGYLLVHGVLRISQTLVLHLLTSWHPIPHLLFHAKVGSRRDSSPGILGFTVKCLYLLSHQDRFFHISIYIPRYLKLSRIFNCLFLY